MTTGVQARREEADSVRLPDYTINDPAILRASAEDLHRIQDERLRNMVRYVYERAPFWREKLDAAGVDPRTFAGVDAVRSLPTCNKPELLREQSEHGYLGRYTCTDRTEWARYFTTSGTTGQPLRRVFSQRDWRQMLDRFARSPLYTYEDIVMITAPVDGLTGPTAGLESAIDAGALVITAGLWSTERKIETIAGLRPTALSGATSYFLHMTEVAAGMGIDLSGCGVKTITCVGEPGAAVEETRKKISERFGGAALQDGYGLTEIFPLGSNCEYSRSLHLSEDMVLVECLVPGTNDPVPPGDLGELVYTNLIGDTQPLLRYRSGDLGRLTDHTPCECGHSHVRIDGSIQGRVDDMIWYRGVNFFPSTVHTALEHVNGVEADHYQVILSGDEGFPYLTVEVEQSSHEGNVEALTEAVAHALKNTLGISPGVEILSPGYLPRPKPGEKVRHVIDKRTSPRRAE